MIYTSEAHDYDQKCHNYGNFQLGKPTFMSDKGLLWDRAPVISDFLGYENFKQILIDTFFKKNSEKRFVRIAGYAGVGKSALV